MIQISLEVSHGICNADCSWCLVKSFRKRQRFTTISEIENFIRINRGILKDLSVNISGFGEPLLNPDFFKIINSLRDSEVKLDTLSTNLSVKLSEEEIKTIVSSFNMISVDMGGLSLESRQKSMRITDDHFKDNLKLLIKLDTNKKCIYKILTDRSNENELHEYIEGVIVSEPILFNSEYFLEVTGSYDYNLYLQRLINLGKVLLVRKPIACNDFTNLEDHKKIRIMSNGDVLLCCMIPYDEDAVVDNAFQRSLSNIFISDNFTYQIDLITKRQYSKYCNICYEIKTETKNVEYTTNNTM